MRKKTIAFIAIAFLNVLVLVGAFFKIMHYPNSDIFLAIGIIGWIPILAYALYDLYKSPYNKKHEKIMWTIAFLFSSSLMIIAYLLVANQREELQRLRAEQQLTI